MNNKFYEALQAAISQNINDMKLSDWLIGTVETVSPLSIRIDQRDVITEEFLTLTDLVRDFNVDIQVNHTTENAAGGGGYAEYASHNHGYKGRKRITVYNGLAVGEVVLLVRQAGAQNYIVLSRLQDHTNVSGQWG